MTDTFESHGIYLPAGASGDVSMLCPQCSSGRKHKHDRCLSVNVDKGVWKCHHPHCGWSGGLRKRGGYIAPLTKPLVKTYEKPKVPDYKLTREGQDWLKSRGISKETADKAWVMSTSNKIMFPYYRGGELVNIKHRKLEEKVFRMEKGAERALYNIDIAAAAGSDVLIWTEGEMDTLALMEAGYNNVVSIPDGAPAPNTKNYSSKFSFLEPEEKFILGYKKHVLAIDGDIAGKKLADELSRRLGPENCLEVDWPEECKDANDVLIKMGRNALREVIDNATDFPVRGIHNIRDLVSDVLSMYMEGDEPGLSTGYTNLDQIYTVRGGEFTVITGVPNHGKSEWLDDLMVNLAKHHGWRFGLCSPENRPLKRHFAKLASKFIGKPFNPGPSMRINEEELREALKWGNDHFSFLLPEDDELTLDNLISLAKILVYRQGINGLVIDPWGDLVHRMENGENESTYIGRQLTKIRQFGRDHNVHIFIVAHPKQLQRMQNGDYPIPTPYDISGSAHWRNKPDNCLCIWRQDTLNKEAGGASDSVEGDAVEVHVQKVRFKQIGRQGKRPLYYDRVTGIYYGDADSLIEARQHRRRSVEEDF